jgi:hypothetical protein
MSDQVSCFTRQDPQIVALTSPIASTGIFELDLQSELLFPFEGTGVDTTWFIEMQPAGNPFNYYSLVDLVFTIDYTALFSPELKLRMVEILPQIFEGDRAFSVRRDLADIWYDLVNSNLIPQKITLNLSRIDFPSYLQDIMITELALSVRRKDGIACDFIVKPSVDGISIQAIEATSVKNIASSRQSGAATWSNLINAAGAITDTVSIWTFELSDVVDSAESVLALLRDGEVDDILIVFTFSGRKPSWN